MRKRSQRVFISMTLCVFLLNTILSVRPEALLSGARDNKKTVVTENKKTRSISTEASVKREEVRYKKGELIVKFHKEKSLSEAKAFFEPFGINVKKQMSEKMFHVCCMNKPLDLAVLIEQLQKDEAVDYAEPNYVRKRTNETSVGNYFFRDQWGLKSSENGFNINIENAWKITKGVPGVVIGVVDSGIDYTHEDISDNLWENPDEIPGNGIDDDRNGYVDDIKGWDFLNEDPNATDVFDHGTHVAGIIAAEDNKVGIVGTAPGVRVAALKVGDESFDTVDIVEAINYGVKKGIRIFNCSYSSADYSRAEMETMKNADALFICAAGNDGLNIDKEMIYPACYKADNILSVGAVDENGKVPEFSNYGAKNVDIAAPGVNIKSLLLNNDYGMGDGTSMAAPFVSGVAGLVLSKNRNISISDLKNVLLQSARVLPDLEGKVSGGLFLDAYRAVQNGEGTADIPIKSVQINKKDLQLSKYTEKGLRALIDPWDATNQMVQWTSSNETIVKVDGAGNVSGIGLGKADVKATVIENGVAFSGVCSVTVYESVPQVHISGEKFRIKIQSEKAISGENTMTFIKPNGEVEDFKGNGVVGSEGHKGYYFADLKVDDDGIITAGEIDPEKDFGTWELASVKLKPVWDESIELFNEKYYKINEKGKSSIYMDDAKFSIKGLKGELIDETKKQENKALISIGADKPTVEKVEVSNKEAFLGNWEYIKIYSKDTTGIYSGKVVFHRPDGTDGTYKLYPAPRNGYYYVKLKISNGEPIGENEVNGEKYSGLWKIKSLELENVAGNREVYFNREFYTFNRVMDFSAGDFSVTNKSVLVNDLILYKTSGSIYPGKKVRLLWSTAPELASFSEISWNSSNPKVATVSKTGIVKGLRAGTALITGTTKDGSKITKKYTIKVLPFIKVEKIKAPAKLTLKLGQVASVKATLTPYYASIKSLTWSATEPGIIRIDPVGKIKAIKKGKTVLKIRATDGTGRFTLCTVTVK